MIILESTNNATKTILVGSPICQRPEILEEFLLSLEEVDKKGLEVHFMFVDDNEDDQSKELLTKFKERNKYTFIESSETISQYMSDDFTHRWDEQTVQKVARFKDGMIDYARENNYDYLFLIDSDIILHPKTFQQLISDKKDIVSNIFWTKWGPNSPELPQVWLKDAYTLYDAKTNTLMTQDDINTWTNEFIEMLKKPGVYRVGGLGACTMISRNALLKGVNFQDVYNISFWGEDRHFCIRAVALGLELFVDTYYPAYHIYRSENLEGVESYKQSYGHRETEIKGASILDVVVAAINDVGTFSYEESIRDSFKKYFTPSEGARQIELLFESRLRIEKQKIINRCNVMQCTMSFYEGMKKVDAQIKLCNNGYKKGYSYYEEFNAICKLEEQPDGKFLISDYEVKDKIPLNSIPFIRKVAEKSKVTLSMVVKNEEGRYLERSLLSARDYIDNAVIIDDGSTDKTVQICKDILGSKLITLTENKESKFANEIELRRQQWFESISTNPDWLMILDADEIFEDRAKEIVPMLARNKDIDAYIFRLYDFWDELNYRDDKLWCAHQTFRPFMIRYQRNFNYAFTETAQHCGRMPANVMSLPFQRSDLRLKHYGWAKEEDRIKKYKRYMKLDPDGQFGSMAQYQSILDPTPSLVRWNEFHINS